MLTITERVARGAALLDEQRPGWAGEINTEELEMSCCFDCILGQLFGDYCHGGKILGRRQGWDLGFDIPSLLPDKPSVFSQLRSAWLAEIATRLTFEPAAEEMEALACAT